MQAELSNRVKQITDVIVTICLVVVSITFVAFAIAHFRSTQNAEASTASRLPSLKKGDVINVGASPASKPDQRTLLIALQTGCRYCKESVPLYRDLSSRAKSLNLKLIFAFPQSQSEGQSYLLANGIHADDIRQLSFSNIKVAGTPTVILLDSQNKVIDFWKGKIPDANLPNFYNSLGS
jgi:thioredoxin-related protein